MITKADDFPIHQTPEPIAYTATSDRNFYDRYFFNGYSRDGAIFFAAAMGSYPNRRVNDAAFNIIYEGRQYVLRASRLATPERMETTVGPIHVEVLEPLQRVRLRIDPNPFGIAGDLTFTARVPVIEEPKFFLRQGQRTFMDYTRLTQHGDWSGFLEVNGKRIDVGAERFWGSRDRSWGVRPVGERDGGAPMTSFQFFWLWAPVNFDNLCTHFDVNEFASGERWHCVGKAGAPGPNELSNTNTVQYHLDMKPGTRHASQARISLHPAGGTPLELEFEPLYNFYMLGIGYGHPQWGHGMYVGDEAVDGESWNLADIDPSIPLYLHVQAVCRVKCGKEHGIGVLEQLIIGPHEPTGFRELFDMA